MIDDLGVGVQCVGQDEVGLPEVQAVHGPPEERRDRHTALAVVGELVAAVTGGAVELLIRRGRSVLAHHHIVGIGGQLAVVDARLLDLDGVGRRLALGGVDVVPGPVRRTQQSGHEVRRTVADRVGRRGHEPVPVGVEGVLAYPGRLGAGQLRVVDLAYADHEVLQATVHLVPIDVELLVEVVERPDLLVLGEGLGDHRGVEQAHRGHDGLVGGQRGGRDRRLCAVRLPGDILYPVRLSGVVNGVLDVRGFLVPDVRLHRELLHHGRVDATDRDRGDAQQRQRRAGPHQVAHAGVGEDQDCDGHHDRDVRQDFLGRQHRVDVGVPGAPQVGAGVVSE